jgi:ATP-dependent HslUV protease, peptidase subunit HslV
MRSSRPPSEPSPPAERPLEVICPQMPESPRWHSTTVLCVRHGGKVAMASDGQVTIGTTVMKQTAAKIRRLAGGSVIAGFAGSSADAFALFSRFEAKLDEHRGNLERSAIELAKDWRTDKMLRQLEALLIVADRQSSLLISGTGDLISPEEGVLAIGSGGAYALAAARTLLKHRSDMSAKDVAHEALLIAAQIDIYTNDHITMEEL